MRNKLFLGIFLIIFIASATFVFFPHKLQVESAPKEMIFHEPERDDVVKTRLIEDDAISTEVRRFITENNTGWRTIIRQLSLGETAPSIEIFGENNSYKLSIWRNEAVLGFPQTKKSYRKKVSPEVHTRLVALIRKKNLLADPSLRGAEGSGDSEFLNR